MSPPARQSWALLSSRVPTHAVASSQQMEGSVKFHQPEPVLERETETQMVWGWRGPRVWGWTGWREGACPTLRGAGGMDRPCLQSPGQPHVGSGLLTLLFHGEQGLPADTTAGQMPSLPGEVAGSDRGLEAPGVAPASPAPACFLFPAAARRCPEAWAPFLGQSFPPDCPGFPCGSEGKESAHNAGDLSLIPGSGRSPGEGNGNPLQCSCLENPMDGGTYIGLT